MLSCCLCLVLPTHNYWQRTRGGWGGTGKYASPWLTLLLLPKYYPSKVCNGGPKQQQLQGWMQWLLCMTAACLTCAAALLISCQQPPVYACMLGNAPCTQLLAAHRGVAGEGHCSAPGYSVTVVPDHGPLGIRCYVNKTAQLRG
jgi:hypothetical protein